MRYKGGNPAVNLDLIIMVFFKDRYTVYSSQLYLPLNGRSVWMLLGLVKKYTSLAVPAAIKKQTALLCRLVSRDMPLN